MRKSFFKHSPSNHAKSLQSLDRDVSIIGFVFLVGMMSARVIEATPDLCAHFDDNSTMSQWTAEQIPDLTGKVALVTGGNSGKRN